MLTAKHGVWLKLVIVLRKMQIFYLHLKQGRSSAKGANKGKIKLTAFKPFCPYTVDVEYYKDARAEFTTSEWIDVLLAVDYNAVDTQTRKQNSL